VEKKVALKDVARYVGVSTALVSYVMNGKEKQGRVGPDMAERIRKAAAKLHYQPNFIAKSLKSGRTNTIGLIVADISNSFFSSIARIIEDEAQKLGYVVIFGSSDEDEKKQNDLITVFLNRQVDAFIIAPTKGTEPQIKLLQKKNVPVVLVDRYFTTLPVDSVHINNYQAAFDAVQHLIANNRKKIAMVVYDTPLAHMQQRQEGYRGALKANGIRFRKKWLVQASYNNITEDVQSGLSGLLDPLEVDAVLFATNSLAVAGLKKINELGIVVPKDLATISFDENDVFDFFYSPVSYVSQSVADIGKEALLLAVDRIIHPRKKSVEKTIDAVLVVRKSSGSA
jgi:LacI family transcriptional regulator